MTRSHVTMPAGVIFSLAVLLVPIGTTVGAPVIEAPPTTGPAVVPMTYHAITDAKYYAKPPTPKLGPAGFIVNDPVFGCPILRVSDEKTYEGSSILTPSGGESNNWNMDSTLFCVLTQGSGNIPYRFDAKTMKATRIPGLDFLPGIQNPVEFSRTDPNIVYGEDARRYMIVQYDFSTNKVTDVLDVAKITGETAPGHMGAFCFSGGDTFSLTCGGPSQNASPYMVVYNVKTKEHHLWNTKEGTIDGKAVANAPHFTQHAGEIDRSGRYVWSLGPGVKGPWFWDIQTGEIYPATNESLGHRAMGYGDMVNDVHVWVYRTLDRKTIDSPKPLMEHPAGEGYFQYDSHISWNNGRPGQHAPALISTEHAAEMGDPKCVWGDEVIAVATDGSNTVWRFCHTRALVHSPRDPKYNFWDTPRGNVSQDGRFFMFNSNWDESVGQDSHSRARNDVFIVKLEQAQPGIAGAAK